MILGPGAYGGPHGPHQYCANTLLPFKVTRQDDQHGPWGDALAQLRFILSLRFRLRLEWLFDVIRWVKGRGPRFDFLSSFLF